MNHVKWPFRLTDRLGETWSDSGAMAKRGIDSLAEIGARLVRTREALGYNQSDFATHAGIGKSTLNQWESGTQRPSLDEAAKLCDRYGLTLEWIYRGNPFGVPHEIAIKILPYAA